ncbi:hypothetical protein ACNKHT_26260 [Shigella flexneri]
MVQAYLRYSAYPRNPETLTKNRNIKPDAQGRTSGSVDQVPDTHHMECGVLLTAK